MGRGSRQVVCGERNGRTLFAPTHIFTNYKKIRKKIKNVEVQKKAGCQISAKQKKFDERDVEGAVPYKRRCKKTALKESRFPVFGKSRLFFMPDRKNNYFG